MNEYLKYVKSVFTILEPLVLQLAKSLFWRGFAAGKICIGGHGISPYQGFGVYLWLLQQYEG